MIIRIGNVANVLKFGIEVFSRLVLLHIVYSICCLLEPLSCHIINEIMINLALY